MAHSILVVDDDDLIRGVTSEMLRSGGFEVTEAATGTDGLRLARGHPDLVVMDVHLPDMDGYEVCRQLKGDPETATIPVLYLSGTFREVEDKVRGLEMGGDGYLTKPVGAAELVATVRALLRMRQAEAGFQEAEVRRRAAESLVAVGRALSQSLDPAEVGQRVADAVRELFGAAASTLYRLDPSGALVSLAVAGDVGLAGSDPVVMPPGIGVSSLAVREGAPVVTPDVLRDPRIALDPDARARAERAGYRTVLAVPLLARGRIIGALAVGASPERTFTDDDTRLAQAFADQAAIALENARLYEETERRRRAAESLAEVGRLVSQSLDPGEVAERIVKLLHGLLASQHVALYRVAPESGDLEPLAFSGDAGWGEGQGVTLPEGSGLSGLALRQRRPCVTADILADPRVALPPDLRARIEQARYRAAAAAPLLVKDAVVGVVSVGAEAGRTFSETDVALLQAFADQAAIALENARLYQEAKRQRQEAEVLAELARDLNASLDLETVLRRVTDAARALCGSDSAKIATWDPAEGAMVFRYWPGNLYEGYAALRTRPGKGLGGYVMASKRPVRLDRRWVDDPRFTKDYAHVNLADRHEAELVVPILIDDHVDGLLYVSNRSRRPFSDRDEAVLVQLADHAAIAIRNARLFADTRAAQAEAEVSERRYREMQQTLRALIDAMPVMINAKDQHGRYVFMNRFQAALYGVAEQDAIGKTAAELLGPEYGAYTAALDRRALETGEALPYYEEEYADAHGEAHTWLTTKVPLRDALGQVNGVATIALDLTDRKLLEAQLRQAQKMEAIGRLAGGVAHDFNNLLTVITGRSQILLSRLAVEDPARRQIDLILKTAEQAAALTRQLLAFSRKQVLQPKVLDLNRIVSRMKKMLRRLIGEHIELVTEVHPGLGHVKADPGQLEQVILNLAVNARDAMPDGGRLTVETADADLDEAFCRQHPGARPGRHVLLAVTDTGIGMNRETQAHLFEPFFTTKGVGKGTGLGLATVYGIVKQSGGYIAVLSAPGHGARFEIYLPRVDEPLSPGADEPWPEELLQGRETILLAEDQPDVRELARDVLQLSGYAVLEAKDGAEALDLAARERAPVHLLLTDVVMPQMSGRELAARLRARHPGLRVLFMSGYTDDAIVSREVLEPGTAFLQKPFTPDALGRKVREVLDSPGASPGAAGPG